MRHKISQTNSLQWQACWSASLTVWHSFTCPHPWGETDVNSEYEMKCEVNVIVLYRSAVKRYRQALKTREKTTNRCTQMIKTLSFWFSGNLHHKAAWLNKQFVKEDGLNFVSINRNGVRDISIQNCSCFKQHLKPAVISNM